MAKYQQYEEYKNSGVEWLGEIPKDWMATELKRNCKVTDGSHHSPAIEIEGLPFVSVTDVGVNEINFIDSKKISDQAFERLVKEGCKPSVGDVLLTKDGTIGRACIVTEEMPDFVILSSLGLLTPSKKLINKYLYYYLISGINIDQMNSVIHGSALRRMTISKINDLVIAFPEKEEDQTQIANFLDHETAQIDTLIEKQQTLIQLLKEKRQAVISHAVTKGLNPNAPMKDSGVEWLGGVPKHWQMKKLKYVGEAKNGLTYSPNDVSDASVGTLVLRSSNIQNARLAFEDNVYVDMKVPERSLVHKDDILICSRNGSRRLIGKNALITEDLAGQAFGAFMVVFRSNINLYLYWILNSPLFEYQSGSFLTSTINQLTIGNLDSMEVPIPPIEEQVRIMKYLEVEMDVFDKLIAKATNAIQLMQERRTALISAAVTGKIDVRGWVAPESR